MSIPQFSGSHCTSKLSLTRAGEGIFPSMPHISFILSSASHFIFDVPQHLSLAAIVTF